SGNATPCEEAQDPDCKCPPGHGCSGEPCEFCRELPRCEPGWEPARIGTVNFRFECRPCPSGSFSRGRRRWCRSWSDCEGSGFLTLREGNSTHNSVC
ncbi:TNR18 factor, partial [Anthoscopus minutus]|nr:TNR18 factor [Anthoscopus minutus]